MSVSDLFFYFGISLRILQSWFPSHSIVSETFYTLLSTLVSESCVTWLLAKAIQWPGAIGLTPEDLALGEGFQEGRGFQAWNEALSQGARTAPGTQA